MFISLSIQVSKFKYTREFPLRTRHCTRKAIYDYFLEHIFIDCFHVAFEQKPSLFKQVTLDLFKETSLIYWKATINDFFIIIVEIPDVSRTALYPESGYSYTIRYHYT